MTHDRRRFLATLAAGAAAAPVAAASRFPPAAKTVSRAGAVFSHGVASGDPLPYAVVLWTRVSPDRPSAYIKVEVTLADDPDFRRVVWRRQTFTGPWRDYTVKVDARGLRPGRTYYYRFAALGALSPPGRTRTAPQGHVENARFGVVSCSNIAFGFFNAYRSLAERSDLDAVIHLGDYIYEYEPGVFPVQWVEGRAPEPARETVSLDDYRMRYAQYRRDPDLAECHRQHPFIVVWDDHEVTNDAWQDGAENHQPETEGRYRARKAAALQAWFEWLPVRDTYGFRERQQRIYRKFRFGDLLELDMLDTRSFGREQQIPGVIDPLTQALLVDPGEIPALLAAMDAPGRQLLGRQQEAWLRARLAASADRDVTWRVLGQQVMVGQLTAEVPNPFDPRTPLRIPINPDQWDGYAAARARILAQLAREDIGNVVFLTGDIHSSWAHDISSDPFDPAVYDPAAGRYAQATEFVTTSVTSAAPGDGLPPEVRQGLEFDLTATTPHLKYVDLARKGYMLFDVTHDRAQADWHYVDVLDPDAVASPGPSFATQAGIPFVAPAAPLAVSRAAPELAPSVDERRRAFFV